MFSDADHSSCDRLRDALERLHRLPDAKLNHFREAMSMRDVLDILEAIDPSASCRFRVSAVLGRIWGFVKFVVYHGLSPTMVRWYMMRETVLKVVKGREILRSRLLFHQVVPANASVCRVLE
jgi:hypothetical protein